MNWIPASWITGSTQLRRILRRAGVTRALSSVRPFLGCRSYEEPVENALASIIRRGDCVWDVGANVGFYTKRFAELVGPEGTVVAFEPIAASYQALVERTRDLSNVEARCEALGAASASLTIALDEDPTSPSNSLVRAASSGNGASQTVRVVSGDQLAETGQPTRPTIIKIDTEGFEEDVLWGMRSLLREPDLRAIVIEVHFAQLEQRGHLRAPARISSLLEDCGFRIAWIDPSHLLATKRAS